LPKKIHELNEEVLKPLALLRQKADEFFREQVMDVSGVSKLETISNGLWATEAFINDLFGAVQNVEQIFFLPIPQNVHDTQRLLGESIARAVADHLIDYMDEIYRIDKRDIHIHNLVAVVMDLEYILEIHFDIELKPPAFDFNGRVLIRCEFFLMYRDFWEDDSLLESALRKVRVDIDQILNQYARGEQNIEPTKPKPSKGA
jgi:hypothetical protein